MKHIKLFESKGAPARPILHYGNAQYGQIFWDDNGNIITAIHENDGDYRSEYMDDLFKHFDIKVKYHKKLPKNIEEKASEYGVGREEGDEEE